MPRVAKGRRKRAYRPKTRSGCITCKIRRVKCDETRPACLKCSSARRACEGYNDVQLLHQLPCNLPVVHVTSGPSFDVHVPPKSRRSFEFFVQRSCLSLAGFFRSDFWGKHVLQAAYHESAVYHAIVAIGSLHETLEYQTGDIDEERDFALQQYNLGIRELLVPLSQNGQRSIDVCLISCILFTCFENMRGHYTSAGLHIRSGAKLLREIHYQQQTGEIRDQLGSKTQNEWYAPLEDLTKIFAGLDFNLSAMIGHYESTVHEPSIDDIMHNSIPVSFSSVEEARNTLEYWRCQFASTQAALVSCDPVQFLEAVEARTDRYTTLLSKFSLALRALIDSKGSSLTQKEDIAIAVLQLHVLYSYASLHLEQLPSNNPSLRDSFLPRFQQMILLGEKVISSALPSSDNRTTNSFCLDMGILIPLYTVASQCQDPIIRRKAITLLRSTSRQEGLWNSLLVAKAAERVVEIEESALDELETSTGSLDGAELSRVQPFLELDAKGGRLLYSKKEQWGRARVNVVEEVFTW
ncbi:putative transcriptional regulatory protein [Lachnellula hyalina]|uniref:Putative transcriptional regulatory protein n=1 Tax=Lachnellula hyalina TaxID=1316788 RepID=A0A8H8TXB7_9HELO|nr:putative transcriptional regulatory protein [Lachnellula hyalina]TVY25839.1 putative transcriptional regulatory protein [Lachnellula hyalina]